MSKEVASITDPIWKPATQPPQKGQTWFNWNKFNRDGPKIVVPIAILTFIIAGYVGSQRALPDIDPFLERTWPDARFERLDASTFVAKKNGRPVGYAAVREGDAYGGSLHAVVAVDTDGTVRSLAIVDHGETASFFQKVLKGRVLEQLLGKKYDEEFLLGQDVDGVSGATYTARGIVSAVREATRSVAADQLGAEVPVERPKFQFGVPEIVLIPLFIIGFVGRGWTRLPLTHKVRGRLRWISLLTGLVVLGFLYNRPMVLAWVTRLMSGDWPAWQTHFYWYLLFFGLVFSFHKDKKNPWCPWMCPFGAVQDCLGLIGGASRRQISHRNLFLWAKRLLAWLAILLALTYRNPAGASYEIFGTMFSLEGSTFQFALLALVVITSILVHRPFCHWVCPVDIIEDLLRVVRRGTENAWRLRSRAG